jgi:ribosomal protein S11
MRGAEMTADALARLAVGTETVIDVTPIADDLSKEYAELLT